LKICCRGRAISISSELGLNALANRLNHLNGKIPIVWLNNSYNKFKIDCKNLLLSFEK
jgi:hypothetical protein